MLSSLSPFRWCFLLHQPCTCQRALNVVTDWHSECTSPKDSPWKLEQHNYRDVLPLLSPVLILSQQITKIQMCLLEVFDKGCFYYWICLVFYRREAMKSSLTLLTSVSTLSTYRIQTAVSFMQHQSSHQLGPRKTALSVAVCDIFEDYMAAINKVLVLNF
jgi:hypothetical protein